MRVDEVRRGGFGGAARKPGAAGGFDALLGTASPNENPAAAAAGEAAACSAPAGPIGAALDYDGAMAAVAADRHARRHGRAMLRALGALQLAMLGDAMMGEGGDGAGAHLATLAAQMPAADDPVLRLVLREIGVRAAVALARMGANPNISIG